MDFFGHKHFQDKLVDLEVWPSDFWELLLRTQNLKTPLSIFLIRINGGGWRLESGMESACKTHAQGDSFVP